MADLARSSAAEAAASVRCTASHAACCASSAVCLTAPLPSSYTSVVLSAAYALTSKSNLLWDQALGGSGQARCLRCTRPTHVSQEQQGPQHLLWVCEMMRHVKCACVIST